jgi:hypothetical protein
MPDIVKTFFQLATNEDVTRKERFHETHDSPARRPLHSQTRVKYFKIQFSGDIGSRDVLVLRLGSGAIPAHA